MSRKLFFIVFALALSFALASPTKKSNYIEQENSCREVCGLCDCDGFYCEDECICECSLDNEQNLQCIADMKTECDANGLEYELMMDETAKERFMREAQDNEANFEKHLFVMKQKRQSNSTDPTVGAAAPSEKSEPVVAAAAPTATDDKKDSTLGNAQLTVDGVSTLGRLSALSSISTSSGLAGLPKIGALPAIAALPAAAALPALPAFAGARSAALSNFDGSKLLIVLRDRLTATKARLAASTFVAPAAAVPAAAASSSLLSKLNSLKVVAPAAAAPTAKASAVSIAGLSSLPTLATLKALKAPVLPVLPAHLA